MTAIGKTPGKFQRRGFFVSQSFLPLRHAGGIMHFFPFGADIMTKKSPAAVSNDRAADVQGTPTANLKELSAQVDAVNQRLHQDNADDAASLSDQERAILAQLYECRVDVGEPIDPDEFLFEWGGVGFLPRCNIFSIKAAAKAGKTFAMTAFAMSFLKGDYMGLRSLSPSTATMLYFDTEQSRNDTRKILHRVAAVAPDELHRIKVFNTKTLDPKNLAEAVEIAVKVERPAVVVIDGLIDLIESYDYNDQAAAQRITGRLLRLAEVYKLLIVSVIHTNKGNDYATGWAGRIMLQRSAGEILVKSEKSTSTRTIEVVSNRHRIPEPIPFRIVDTADAVGATVELIPPEAYKAEAAAAKAAAFLKSFCELKIPGFSCNKPHVWKRCDLVTKIYSSKVQSKGSFTKQGAQQIIRRGLDCNVFQIDGENILYSVD